MPVVMNIHTELYMNRTTIFVASALALAAIATSPSAAAQRASAQSTRAAKTQDIPVCSKKLGTITVLEPQDRWWTDYGLSSPEALIKLFVSKSKCFTLVDRNKGMDAMMGERALASSGELRGRSNMGKGQIKAADYALVPDLISRNSNAGGTNVGSALGGLIGGRLPRGRYPQMKSSMDVPKTLVAPITKGQKIGTVKVTLDGKEIASAPLVALEPVEEAGFFKRLWHEIRMWWASL